MSAGAAAGLSAAFSAPLSGMMFALEGIHRSFSPTILMGATAASLTADFVSKYCFGLRPVLDFGAVGQLPLAEYIWLIPLGKAESGICLVCILFAAKLMFTSTSFGSGTPGGIFMPILAIGSLAGGICGEAARQFCGLQSQSVAVFAVCVMTGTLAAAVRREAWNQPLRARSAAV